MTANGHELFPLSAAQAGVWMGQRVDPDSPAFNFGEYFEIEGNLDLRSFETAARNVINRADVLHIRVVETDDGPRQWIALDPDWEFPILDLTSEVDPHSAAEAWMRADLGRVIDLTRERLFCSAIFRVASNRFYWFLRFHHLCNDGVGNARITEQVAADYRALIGGRSTTPGRYPRWADVVAGDLAYRRSPELAADCEFFRAVLSDRPESWTFSGRAPTGARRHLRATGSFPAAITEELRGFDRRFGVTLPRTLLAVSALYHHRVTGRGDIVLGSTFSGRTELRGMTSAGMYARILPLRLHVDPEAGFDALARQTDRAVHDLLPHQRYPAERLRHDLGLLPDEPDVFGTVVNVMPVNGHLNFGGCQARHQNLSNGPVRDLEFSIYDYRDPSELRIEVDGNPDHYTQSALDAHLQRLLLLMESVVRSPIVPVRKHDILTPPERRQLLKGFRSVVDAASLATLPGLFERQVSKTPDAVAVVFGAESVTYAELNARANQLAHVLIARAIGPEQFVGIALERSLEMVVAVLATLKAGAAYLPLDMDQPAARMARMVRDAAPAVVITAAAGAERLSDMAPVLRLDLAATRELLARSSPIDPTDADRSIRLCSQHPAYVIYTSGSTGTPKGVVVTHQNVVRLLVATSPWFDFGPGDVWPLFHSLAFDVSVWELWGPLSSGGRLVVVTWEVSRSPEDFLALLVQHQVTVLNQTPSAFRELMQADASNPFLSRRLALRLVIFAGEALELKSLEGWVARHGDRSPLLVNMYGITETTVHVTYQALNGALIRDSRSSLIGENIPDLRIYVLNPALELVPIGVEGEIYVAGGGLARGYLHCPGLTAGRFVADPFSSEPGARMYRSGDLARRRVDGTLEFLGRADQQVKIRGFRIELGEIETALEAQPQVTQAVVIARDDGPLGRQLVAYLVPAADAAIDLQALRKELSTRVPDYMVPGAFVILARMPLTINGKLDRRGLPQPERLVTTSIAPRTADEASLCTLFAELLSLERVGIHDNFFALGGHSLLTARLVNRVRKVFQIEIPIRTVFANPSVAELAAWLAESRTQSGRAGIRVDHGFPTPTTAGRAEGLAPNPMAVAPKAGPTLRRRPPDMGRVPSYAQERLWFFEQLEPGTAVYNEPTMFRLRGPLHDLALERSVRELVRRHEVLRITMAAGDGQPRLKLLGIEEFHLMRTDLQSQPAGEREAAARKIARDEAARPFDLSRDLMLRAHLVQLDDREQWLLLTMHHIASDGWSLGVLERELTALYAAYVAGHSSPLPELSLQYCDYAIWQREWLADEAFDRQLAYWKEQLAGAADMLDLPTDFSPAATPSFRGASQEVLLDELLTQALENLSRSEGATLFMTLLAAFQLLLSRYSGQEDISVGVPIAGRNREELEELIGFFVNTLVLRTDLSGNPTFRELVGRVREVALGAYAHEDLPFERIVIELNPPRHVGRHPLCDVMLNFLESPGKQLTLPEIVCERLRIWDHFSKFLLTLYASREKGLRLQLVYRTDRFSEERMRLLLEQLQLLLEQAVANPDQPIGSLSLRTQRSQNLLPNPTDELKEPVFPPVTRLFRQWAERTPSQIAVEQGGSQWTYLEIQQLSENVARELRAGRFRAGDVAALYGQRSAGMVVGMLGILSAGGVLVIVDPDLPAERREVLLREAAPRAIVSMISDPWIDDCCRKHPELMRLDIDPQSGAVDTATGGELNGDELQPAHGNDPAYIFFTSGTTGTPKGVVNCHKALSHFLDWQRTAFALSPADRVAQLTGLSFDVLMREIFLPVTSGGTLSLPEGSALPDPQHLFEWLVRQRISVLHSVPSLVEFWLDHAPEGTRLPDLRLLFIVGEPLTDKLVARLRGCVAADCQIVNLYGSAETGPAKCAYVVPPQPAPGCQPIGGAISNTQALVLDRRRRLCGIGEIGEIAIRSAFLARGYLKAELNGGFATNPFRRDESDRVYFTGDRGRYRLDGMLEILGRSDDQIKIRGVRVEPAEVTAHLLQHSDVGNCAVVPIMRKQKTYLVAYVVGPAEAPLDPNRLRSYLTNRVSPVMIPAAFVILDALPLNPNGKVDRKALPIPDDLSSTVKQAPVEPTTSVEIQLASTWCEVLSRESVGIHDNFFALGGHSLLATQIVSRIRLVFSVEIPLRMMFELPTVAEMARYIMEQQARSESASGMESLLDELESLSEESAAEQLRAMEPNAAVPPIPPDRPSAAAGSFHCPSVRSEWFGKRQCNLLIILNEYFEAEGFERVARYAQELDPSINAMVIRDQPSQKLSLAELPTLIFAPALLRHRPPVPGTVFCGAPLSKSEEYKLLGRAGIPVPKWVLLTEEHMPDLSGFGDYVVRKPDYGGQGAEVTFLRRNRARWKPITTRSAGSSPVTIIQELVYTGQRPVSYRVNTLFGKVLYSIRYESAIDSFEPTADEENVKLKPRGGASIVASARSASSRLNYDEEILRLGESAHAAFPEIPLLGFDIVREVPSGKLFVLEANAIGYVWSFDASQPTSFGYSFEEQFDGVRKAAYILAEKTQRVAGTTYGGVVGVEALHR